MGSMNLKEANKSFLLRSVYLFTVSATDNSTDSKVSNSVVQMAPQTQVSTFSAKLSAKSKSATPNIKIVKAGSTSTVYNKSVVLVRHDKPGKVKTYFKIKPKTSGTLTISTFAGSQASINGANAGYVRSGNSTPQFRYITFGVKKGKTYTVTVNSYVDYINGVLANQVAFLTKSFDGKFGKSAKKAAKLTRKKERKGYIEQNGKPKYYKLSKKSKKIKITFSEMQMNAYR